MLEGISGSGKSTLSALLAERLGGRHFHTVPAPVSDLQPYINARTRPLPQLAFYLAGALHASDLARDALQEGHAVADRYVNSVIAIATFTGYLAAPDVTVYLHTSPAELARRMSAKPDQTRSDRDLLDDSDLLRRLQDRYDQIAAADPTARHLQTTRRTPGELAERIVAMLPGLAVAG